MRDNRDRQETDRLSELLSGIKKPDIRAMEQAKLRWNSVAKPIGSLGILEEDIIKIAGMRQSSRDVSVEKSALAVFCADHDVVKEGVTQTGQEVTRIVAENLTKNMTSVTIMCSVSGTDVFPIDIGMKGETPPEKEFAPGILLNRKIACGSRNIVKEAAMSEAECINALSAGISLVGDLKKNGYEIVLTGEMGIGNTTPSSALAAVRMNRDPRELTGRGAGLSDEGLSIKQRAVAHAVERFYKAHPFFQGMDWTKEDPKAALTLLSELGGFDIAGMTGCFLGAAIHRIPVVIDGMISAVAALLAVSMNHLVREYILASHVSQEPAGQELLNAIGLKAPLHCGMRLGEGSGAAAFLPILKMGSRVYKEMGTFEDISVESYVDYEAGGNRS